MKKIIGILGVAVIAATMFFSANAVSGSANDTSLAALISMNTANAETGDDFFTEEEDCDFESRDCIIYPGSKLICSAGNEACTSTECGPIVPVGGQ